MLSSASYVNTISFQESVEQEMLFYFNCQVKYGCFYRLLLTLLPRKVSAGICLFQNINFTHTLWSQTGEVMQSKHNKAA